MILPENRSRFSSRRRPGGRLRIFTAFGTAVIVSALFFLIYNNIGRLENFFKKPQKNQIILDLWETRNYSDLILFTNTVLEENPADFEALVFLGFAGFYEGTARVNQDEKISYIDDTVFNLRKALLFDDKKLNPQINYILGKAYYHKGKFYSDLAVKYLEKALDADFTAADIYEYLGLAYSELGDKNKSAQYFEQAAAVNPSDLLFLVLAQIYMDKENYPQAEEFLLRSNNITADNKIREKNLFMLAMIHEKRNNYIKAEESYQQIIMINPGSADAHYHLGLLYETMGDNIKARAELRKALRIDPHHYGTRLKLF